jgi:endoplasmic reticulum Man9GlcNAc2 1,2-alpha-mannosidase
VVLSRTTGAKQKHSISSSCLLTVKLFNGWQSYSPPNALEFGMNTRDPFGHHNPSALSILQSGVSAATDSAVTLSRQTLETSKQVIETGKQALEESGILPDGMSFSLPSNIPSFTSPQRRFEDSRWGSSGTVHGPRSTATGNRASGGVGNGLGGYFKDKDLPLYKDKPFTYASSRRRRPLWRRKRLLVGAVLFFGLIYWLELFSGLGRTGLKWDNRHLKAKDWDGRRERVKEIFVESWEAYERYAWGMSNISIFIRILDCIVNHIP